MILPHACTGKSRARTLDTQQTTHTAQDRRAHRGVCLASLTVSDALTAALPTSYSNKTQHQHSRHQLSKLHWHGLPIPPQGVLETDFMSKLKGWVELPPSPSAQLCGHFALSLLSWKDFSPYTRRLAALHKLVDLPTTEQISLFQSALCLIFKLPDNSMCGLNPW